MNQKKTFIEEDWERVAKIDKMYVYEDQYKRELEEWQQWMEEQQPAEISIIRKGEYKEEEFINTYLEKK